VMFAVLELYDSVAVILGYKLYTDFTIYLSSPCHPRERPRLRFESVLDYTVRVINDFID